MTTFSRALLALLLVGCDPAGEAPAQREPETPTVQPGEIAVDPGAEQPVPVQRAVAVVYGTSAAPDAIGIVRFDRHPEGGLSVHADVTGLPPGPHAYHLHVYGDCTGSDAETAGTHFDLLGSSLDPPEEIERITGNLGELVADETGYAHAEMILKDASLHGDYTILGRSVVVHEQGNDPSQPPLGGAGGRLACGVVGIAEAETHA